jgi:hypothetical protein
VLIVVIVVDGASRLGMLVVHSWSLRGGELEDVIIWDIATVRAVSVALDRAMPTQVRGSQDALNGKGR